GHVAPALGPSPSTSLAGLLPDSLRNLDRKHLNRWLLTCSSTRRVLVGANTPGEGEAATGEHVRAALARGRYPRRLFELAANSLRLYANALAYACLLADAFASFKRQRGFAKGRLITQQGGAPISKALARTAR